MLLVFRTASCLVFSTVCAAHVAQAEERERWNAPFGGAFSADFTVASEYSSSGVSLTKRAPAFQMGIDYKTAEVSAKVPLWLYVSGWGSNIDFPATGSGVEIDLAGGLKFNAFDGKLSVDTGYIRYLYPGVPASLSYDYGEFNLKVEYDFGVASLAGRFRYSSNSFGSSGNSWNKRGMLSVPLPFLSFNEHFAFKAYATLGNLWVERFLDFGIPSSDYWYWQVAVVTSAYGLDLTVAYTDTSIEPAGCGNTSYCAGRVIVSVTKTF